MAISKDKKKEIFEAVEKIVDGSKAVVFVNFHGLSMADTTEMRKGLRGSKVGYTVAKKTITKKVLEKKGIPGTMPEMAGELALVYADDAILPAREIYSFQKKYENRVSILGGIFEGKFSSREEMSAIALIPSLQALRGQFVNLINSPIQGLVLALNEISKKK